MPPRDEITMQILRRSAANSVTRGLCSAAGSDQSYGEGQGG